MHQRYKDARSIVAMEQPFFATVLFHLKEEETTRIDTMATDGKTIFVNPDFVEKLTLQETAGVIIHEVCHVVFMHHLRMAELDNGQGLTKGSIAKMWNAATDFAINYQLHEDKVVLPEPHLYDKKWEGMNAEEIYERLVDNAEKIPESGGIGEVMPGVDDEGDPLDSGGVAKEKVEITSMILQAGEMAKKMGNLPGFAKELIDKLTESKVDWREVLWQHVSSGHEFGFNWTKPNRRYHASKFIMPSFGAKGMPALNCIIDTSASVSGDELSQFLTELNAAVEAYGIEDVITVMCDTQVNAVHHHCAKDGEVTFEAAGRGGTDMNPAFDELRRHRPAPTILFSDMCVPEIRPFDSPTIFCRCGGGGRIPNWGVLVDV